MIVLMLECRHIPVLLLELYNIHLVMKQRIHLIILKIVALEQVTVLAQVISAEIGFLQKDIIRSP